MLTDSKKIQTPRLSLEGLSYRDYGVSVKYFTKANERPSKRIDYSVKTLVRPYKGEIYLLDVFKNDIWFNQHEPDTISEVITNEISKSIYPISVSISERDFSVDEIANHLQILDRWKKNKCYLEEKFNTDVTRSFYQAFENAIQNKKYFLKSMQNDWFWNLLFHQNYIDYGHDNKVKTDLYLSIIPYDPPFKFKGVQTFDNIITNYNSIQIQFKSDDVATPDYFKSKILDTSAINNNNLLMRINVFYDLDIYYHFPMHIRAYFEVFTLAPDGKETILHKIHYTQYQQNTHDNKTYTREKGSQFFVEQNKHKEDKEVYKEYEGKAYTYHEWIKFEEKLYKEYKEKKKKKGFWDLF
ncbi:hypothetical protein PG637_02355 [Riemerella anatipestifer]|nr:hypothetical protein [Riemerella anatipestifer]MDY3324513.1 hypothetical protein [Riemerella anatipestifer]MDY3353324.1 hypothetical protein [Riemerella anatipestifer]